MKAIDDKAVQIKVCELMFACISDNYEEAYKAKDFLFQWIGKICNDLDGALREVDYLSGQLESANNDLKKVYEEKEALEEQLHPWIDDDPIPDDGGKFSEQDLPFPDIEDLAPAEEVEGSEE